MDDKIRRDKKIISEFNNMWLDSLLSLQPTGTYVSAYNALYKPGKGLVNEQAIEIFVPLPGNIRGMVYVEERDQYVVFLDTESGGEIGIIDEKRHSYKKVVDTTIAPELGICQDQWIDCEVKVKQPCMDLYLYWSSNDIYKRINLDDPCCKFEEIELIHPVSIGYIETDVRERGGGLLNGVYQFVAKARDLEGNDSNWSKISNTISISDGDNKPGERSNKAINLKIHGVKNREYHIMDLAVVSTIDGMVTIEQFDTVSANSDTDVVSYTYIGKTGREFALTLSTITNRTNRFIRGKNLIQFENRLVLYNLRPIANLDYQKQANEIEPYYISYLVPIEKADRFKGQRRNENYLYSISWNYTDGTFSKDFVISGRPGCADACEDYKDDSYRTKTYIDFDVSEYVKKIEVSNSTNHAPVSGQDDESTSIPEGEIDEGTLEDAVKKQSDKAEYSDQEEMMDCLCSKLDAIIEKTRNFVGNDTNNHAWEFTGVWDIDDDIIGLVTIYQLKCMCDARKKGKEKRCEINEDLNEQKVDNRPKRGTLGGDFAPRFGLTGEPPSSGTPPDGGAHGEDGSKKTDECDLKRSKSGRRYSAATSDAGTGTGPGQGLTGSLGLTLGQGNALIKKMDGLEERDGDPRDGRGATADPTDGAICRQEGYTTCVGNICYTCKDGLWRSLVGVDSYNTNAGYSKTGKIKDTTELGFEVEYAEDGCTILGIVPRKYTEGEYGTHCTEERYPETLDCNCEYIYGDLAGEKLRLCQIPSDTREPSIISFSSGVPNKYDQGNSEFKDTYACMIGPAFRNIQPPRNPPKPINESNPYTIKYAERTEANKTVLCTGTAHSCFLGEIGGEAYAFPKHAGNSFERFDRHIEPSNSGGGIPGVPFVNDTFRGGGPIDVGAYIIHSPDLHMRRPYLTADTCLIELEMTGLGFRHGMFSEGEKPENASQDKWNQKVTRQAINLNQYNKPPDPIVRKVKAMSVAPSDCIVSKADKFTYSLCNLMRESSVYVELEGKLEPFTNDGGLVGGYGGAVSTPDGASDRSFTGDMFTETIPIHDVKCHQMTFMRKLPNQYGSLIQQAYIPLMESKGMSSTIGELCGDSFVGPMTYKRTALVSDKTNRMISKFISVGGISGRKGLGAVLGNMMAFMFRVIGLRNGGYVPKNQDPSDHMRVFGGLRFINNKVLDMGATVSYVGETTEGSVPPPIYPAHKTIARTSSDVDINFGDNYVPQGLVTQITSYYSSDVNLNYRQLGALDNGEIYYSPDSATLKGMKIDSSIPEETPWKKGWLNRWYSEWKENARWKLIVQAILIFAFNYGIGLAIIMKGIESAVNAFQATGGGMYALQTIGAIIGTIFGLIIIVFGVGWISYWAHSDADNKFIEEFVSMKNLRPDRRNSDGSFSMNESRLRQFENNYFKCDNTHSIVNKWEVSYGMPDPYDTCSCPTIYHNGIVYSNEQNMMSQIDSWRNFKPHNNLELTSEHGKLKKLFRLGQFLYAHTSDMLIKLSTVNTNRGSTHLGTGELFGDYAAIYGGVVEGYGGLLDPNAAKVSTFGYIFPDRESRKWYTFTGELPKPISDDGVSEFMNDNMRLYLLDAFPDFKLVDMLLPGGIGFTHGVDYRNDRILFTKTDYRPRYPEITLNSDKVSFSYAGKTIMNGDPLYFEDTSFTLSYKPGKGWISFHNYAPPLYAWNRFDLYSFTYDGMWIHNVKGKYQTYYGKYFPFSVEYAIHDPETLDAFAYTSTVLGTEAYKIINEYPLNKRITFDKMLAYNSHQSTGMKDFIISDDMSLSERSMEHFDRIKLLHKNRIWTFKDVANYAISPDDYLFNPGYYNYPRPVNEPNIGKDVKSNLFYDNFFANRLVFDGHDDVELILKRIETNISYDSR